MTLAQSQPSMHALFSEADFARAVEGLDWGRAAELIGPLAATGEISAVFRLNLMRNLAALKQHRPAVHDWLCANRGRGATYQIVAGTGIDQGLPTVVEVTAKGPVSQSVQNDPKGALAAVWEQLAPDRREARPTALLGLGDGYLLMALARHPWPLPFGRKQSVHVLETEAGLVWTLMTIHDMSGPAGPIEQQRFQWFVGEGCMDELSSFHQRHMQSLLPDALVVLRVSCEWMRGAIAELAAEFGRLDARLKHEVEVAYLSKTPRQLAMGLAGRLGRKPRVVLLTTRFSTVLQYSTRDTQEAFERLGFDTRLVIEEADHQMMTLTGVRALLCDFQPDLFFQIDHHRHEHRDLLPPELPFACWIQDHLNNLTSREVGRKLGFRDFTLTDVPAMYCGQYDYPARQTISLAKCTRVPGLPAAWTSDGDEFSYVSHASRTPEQATEQVIAAIDDAATKRVVRETAGRMVRHYEAGQSIGQLAGVSNLLAAASAELGVRLSEEVQKRATNVLFDLLNNVLYRQQALGWVADACQKRGMRLGIYGNGWDKHPTLGRFARGPVEYGGGLEELTRKTVFNLQIVPYFCLHQRLLDGIVAGGFFLVRRHEADTLMQRLSNFLFDHVPHEGDDTAGVLAACPVARRDELATLIEQNRIFSDMGDVVSLVRGAQRSCMLVRQEEPVPGLDSVSFGGPVELDNVLDRWHGKAAEMRQLVMAQRANVENRLSYRAGMERTVKQIVQRLTDEAAGHLAA